MQKFISDNASKLSLFEQEVKTNAPSDFAETDSSKNAISLFSFLGNANKSKIEIFDEILDLEDDDLEGEFAEFISDDENEMTDD